MKKLFYTLFLLLPLTAFAQVETEHEVMHDVDVPVEEVSAKEDFLRSIPKGFKDGKPHIHQYNKLWGYVLNDSILIPFIYEDLDFKYSDFMICREPRKYYGVINKKGETVIPFEYVSIKRYFDVLFAWKKDAGCGVMNLSGKELVPFEYEKGTFGADTTLVFMSPGKQLVVRPIGGDKLQVLIESNYEEMSTEPVAGRPLLAVKQQGRWGILDYQNRLVIPCEYDKIQKVFEQHVVAVKNGKTGVVHLNGTLEVPFEYETIPERLKNGLFRFGVKAAGGKQRNGLVDSTGQVVAQAEYDAISQFYYCDLMKVSKGGKWGILDRSGKLRSPLQFADLSAWKHNAPVEKKDESGKSTIVYKEAYGLYFVHKHTENGKIGLWHLDKGEIIPPLYDYYEIFDLDGPIEVTLNEKRALFNGKGKQLTGFDYNSLSVTTRPPQYMTAQVGGKRTLLNASTGKQIQPEYYDDWYYHNIKEMNGYFYTKIGDFTALHAPNGRRLTSHKYWASITPYSSIPEVEAQLPKGRKIVACARTKTEYAIRFFAIDDTGAEYEYKQK
ncbi:MAG: WG repeat-containing protein [Saprospiraceae bacterium]|nr:WG repeat-containing protein [Saprospiraceae bacterium]